MIHENLKKEIPEALRARDEIRLRTLRSLVTAMTNELIRKRKPGIKSDLIPGGPNEFLTDEEAVAVLKRAANQRKDSIEQFEKGGRPELALPEKAELAIIENYLPAQISKEDMEKIVRAKAAELNVTSKDDAGKLTGAVMKELKGKADGGDVKAVVDALLS